MTWCDPLCVLIGHLHRVMAELIKKLLREILTVKKIIGMFSGIEAKTQKACWKSYLKDIQCHIP